MGNLLLPVRSYDGLSSWAAHQRRGTPSSEPGTDLYVPIGTPIYAPADGVIWGYGTSISPATGRWVGINFDNGMSFRALHASRLVKTYGRVARGELIAYSGASGYGEEDWSWNVAETGGAHTHVTLWPTHEHRYGYRSNGTPYTIDFMEYVGGSSSGDSSKPFEEDDMYTDEDRKRDNIVAQQVSALYAAVFGPKNLGESAGALGWTNWYGDTQSATYGILPILIQNQNLIAKLGTAVAGIDLEIDELRAATEVKPVTVASAEEPASPAE